MDSFDLESFLKGLAVGRVLWNPAVNGSIYGTTSYGVPQDADEESEDNEES